MKTDKKQIFPERELIEYEKVTTMTAEEQAALRTWVAEGNSVHENASMGVDETGEPLDFLEVYRMEEKSGRISKNCHLQKRINILPV